MHGVDAEGAAPADNSRMASLGVVEAGVPHQGAVTEHPEFAHCSSGRNSALKSRPARAPRHRAFRAGVFGANPRMTNYCFLDRVDLTGAAGVVSAILVG